MIDRKQGVEIASKLMDRLLAAYDMITSLDTTGT